jgi:hypothetical protein
MVDAIELPAFLKPRFEARGEASGFDLAILQRLRGNMELAGGGDRSRYGREQPAGPELGRRAATI